MIGRKIAGRYEITKPLDSGGMGQTYIAIDTQFPNQPQCVVKRLLPASKDPEYLAIMQRQFRSEAATLARVGEHDQIPRLLAYPEENQEFYLVQEYIEGHTLSTELKQRWSEAQVLSFLREILEILEFLQSQDPQVIHRDIKPANIIRRSKDNKLVLIDFGAVKEWQAQQLTLMGKPSIVIGTPEYMPAEQFKGKPRPSSDLYAVGMIAIQALTGLLPSALEEDEDGEPLWQSNATVSDGLAEFLSKMVQRDFKGRYQTAAEASQALQEFMRGAETVVTPRSTPKVNPPFPPPLELTPTEVTPRPGIPQKPKRISTLPSTVYQPPQSPVATRPADPSRRSFLKQAAYVGLGAIGATTAYFLTVVRPSKSPSGSRSSSQLKRFQFETVSVDAQGNITKRKTGEAEFFAEDLGNGVMLDMVAIPGGSFTMGSPASELEREDNEGPQRRVTIQPFYIGKYAVTQAQWQAVAQLPQVNQELKANPSNFKGENLPVENVSWHEAKEFCLRLSQLTKKTYRLPSEAEWEYACRAGTQTPFHFGETLTTDLANYDGNDTYGKGSKGVSRKQTVEVGSFSANAFGLFDMHGNVGELCQDFWHKNYQGAPTDGSAWLTGNRIDSRFVRGGSWSDYPRSCRCAYRSDYAPDNRNDAVGFRVVCVLPRTL